MRSDSKALTLLLFVPLLSVPIPSAAVPQATLQAKRLCFIIKSEDCPNSLCENRFCIVTAQKGFSSCKMQSLPCADGVYNYCILATGSGSCAGSAAVASASVENPIK